MDLTQNVPALTDTDTLYQLKEYSEKMRDQLRAVNARMDVTTLTQVIGTAAWTTATYGAVAFDTENPSMCSAAGGTITPQLPGIYLVVFNAGIGGMSNTAWAQGARITVAGATLATTLAAPSGAGGSMSVSAIARITAGQQVKGDVYQNSGSNKNFSAASLALTRLAADPLTA